MTIPSSVALIAGRALQRREEQRHADADDHRAEHQPLAERRVVAAAARVGDRQEGDQRGRDEDRRADVAAA